MLKKALLFLLALLLTALTVYLLYLYFSTQNELLNTRLAGVTYGDIWWTELRTDLFMALTAISGLAAFIAWALALWKKDLQ